MQRELQHCRGEKNQQMICDIVTSKEDLDHYVEAYKNVCLVLKLCADMEEHLGTVWCCAMCPLWDMCPRRIEMCRVERRIPVVFPKVVQ